MRHHIQGVILLIVMFLAFWVTVSLAGPVVSDALSGEDRALHAESSEVVAPDEEESPSSPLTEEEVLELQAALTEAGYDAGGIDGIMGPTTRAAADQAIVDRALPESTSYRNLSSRLQAENAGLDPNSVRPDLDWETISDRIEEEARAEAIGTGTGTG